MIGSSRFLAWLGGQAEVAKLDFLTVAADDHWMNYRVTLVESEEGVAVWCDDLPGCASQGSTKQEAVDNIREAIQEYLEAIPIVEATFKTKVSKEEVAV